MKVIIVIECRIIMMTQEKATMLMQRESLPSPLLETSERKRSA